MQMLLLSFFGSALAYFAFMSAASSAAAAQAAAASNWPPTAAQQQALQVQISALVLEVTGRSLTSQQQINLQNLLAAAPAQYQASLPAGASATIAGYQAWVLAGSAAQASSQAQQTMQSYGTSVGAGLPTPLDIGGVTWDEYGNGWPWTYRGYWGSWCARENPGLSLYSQGVGWR